MNSFSSLISALKVIFEGSSTFLERRERIEQVLDTLELLPEEIDRYLFFDEERSYTRNLVYTSSEFSLLLLCWTPGSESKIHNHPCQGCFS